MILEYGTQLSPSPILLSIGSIKKPKLREIADITFGKFNFYEILTKMTPDVYYEKVLQKPDKKWEEMTDYEKENSDIYDFLIHDEHLQKLYLDLLNFFFVENVIFREEIFIILNEGFSEEDELTMESVRGVIGKESFPQVMNLIQQVCCIYSEENTDDELKFKNSIAKKIYEKIHKGEHSAHAKYDMNLSIPNIISSVSAKHPSINLLNIWEMTVFQLIDSFHRLQTNAIYDIDSARVSAWGDEKKTFDVSLWYKNNYDKRDQQ